MYTIYRNRAGVLVAIPYDPHRHTTANYGLHIWDAKRFIGVVPRDLVPVILLSRIRTRAAFVDLVRKATALLERCEADAKA